MTRIVPRRLAFLAPCLVLAGCGVFDSKKRGNPVPAPTEDSKKPGISTVRLSIPEFTNAVEDLATRATQAAFFVSAQTPELGRIELYVTATEPSLATLQARVHIAKNPLAPQAGITARTFTLSPETFKAFLKGQSPLVLEAQDRTGSLHVEFKATKPASLIDEGGFRRVELAARIGVRPAPVAQGPDVAKVDSATTHDVVFNLQDASSLNPRSVRVAGYNVENMWDDVDSENAYDEYKASGGNWISEKMYDVKARQIARALALAGTPDVAILNEIESAENASRSLEILRPVLGKMGYRFFALGRQDPNNPSAVTTAVVSKFPITRNERIDFLFDVEVDPARVGGEDKAKATREDLVRSSRDPQKVDIAIAGAQLRVYAAHGKSKRSGDVYGDMMRKKQGELIQADLQAFRAQNPGADVIVLGDLNAHYTEAPVVEGYQATGDLRELLTAAPTHKLYNLWYELPVGERCDYPYDGKLECIDNFLVADSVYDTRGLTIVPRSYQAIGKTGLARDVLVNADGAPLRWQLAAVGKGVTRHPGVGFSDHLPLTVDFTVSNPSARAETGAKGAVKVTKITVDQPSATPVGPSEKRDETAAPCTADDVILPLSEVDVTSPAAQGACVRLTDAALPVVEITRDHAKGKTLDTGVEWRGTRLMITLDRSFGVNKNFVRTELSNAVGRTLEGVVGRLGWSDDVPAVFAHSPDDIDFAPVVLPPCVKPSDAASSVASLTDVATAAAANTCVGFQDLALDISADVHAKIGEGQSFGFNFLKVALPTGLKVTLRMSRADAKDAFPTPGSYVVSGQAVLVKYVFEGRGEWQLNLIAGGSSATGGLTDVRPAGSTPAPGEGNGGKGGTKT